MMVISIGSMAPTSTSGPICRAKKRQGAAKPPAGWVRNIIRAHSLLQGMITVTGPTWTLGRRFIPREVSSVSTMRTTSSTWAEGTR
jgi:hypothetical protein